MPPRPKTKEQLNEDKKRIIDEALKIMEKSGLSGLTMRNLSKEMGMSAANMYNYFHGKDEIYIHILISGFSLLQNKLDKSINKTDSPLTILKKQCNAFISFGLENQAYYEIMFSTKAPKSLDYVGTKMEKLAKEERELAITSLKNLESIVSKCAPEKNKEEIFIISTRIVCMLHGGVNLLRTNIIKEIGADADDVLKNLVDAICQEFE